MCVVLLYYATSGTPRAPADIGGAAQLTLTVVQQAGAEDDPAEAATRL